ncbi:MAG: phosphotyrosine protein phosphatase [bacterium]
MTKLLFVCSRNQWRSPTAEAVWRAEPGVQARSAGTSSSARRRVSLADLEWADFVFVMENKHREILRRNFSEFDGEIHVLGITDDYRFMDEELVEMIYDLVVPIVGEPS